MGPPLRLRSASRRRFFGRRTTTGIARDSHHDPVLFGQSIANEMTFNDREEVSPVPVVMPVVAHVARREPLQRLARLLELALVEALAVVVPPIDPRVVHVEGEVGGDRTNARTRSRQAETVASR